MAVSIKNPQKNPLKTQREGVVAIAGAAKCGEDYEWEYSPIPRRECGWR